MYNPDGSDTDNEWIELYNNDNETYNLTGWKLNTDDTNHTLNVPPIKGGQGTMIMAPDAYVIIAQNATAFLTNYVNYSGTVIDSSWVDLKNSQNESIIIKNSTNIFDNITYSIVPEGNTSCRINGSFVQCIPTPGTLNMAYIENNTNSTNQTSVVDIITSIPLENATVNMSYTIFQINITNKTCGVMDNITISYNISPGSGNNVTTEVDCSAKLVNWTPTSSGNYTICGHASSMLNESNMTNNDACKSITAFDDLPLTCDSSVIIIANGTINAGSTLDYDILLNDTNCDQPLHNSTIEYWIQDSSGNYAKDKLNTSQSFVCSKTIGRQWTPQDMEGDKNYKIIAKIISNSCNDTNIFNDGNETTVLVHGSVKSTTSTTSSGGSSSISTPITKKYEIISYPSSVFIDDPFYVTVKIFNPAQENLFSVYSYVYKDTTPVSQGFNGSVWKGSWDANKIEILVPANGTSLIKLLNKIENGTSPGIYNLRVKIKTNKEEEITKLINVTGSKPELKIKNFNGTLNISTNCADCEIRLIGSNIDKIFNNSFLISNVSGVFYVSLIKDSEIILNYSINVSGKINPVKNSTKVKSVNYITGFITNKNFVYKIDNKYLLLLQLLSKIKLF